MVDLVLAVKEEYFNQIKSGLKTEEYRLYNDYWKKRLIGRNDNPYKNIVITLGYPKKDDAEKRLVFTYTGWERKWIQHKHFGNAPVEVFAIPLTNKPLF